MNNIEKAAAFKIGQDVTTDGRACWIKEICTGVMAGMVVVQLPSGTLCISAQDVDAK